ncbi:glycoside hydrolase family 32 protein [Hespellia stercorisuis]|uniref:Sucrose-6-phosphate hydrolase n=1 Tax=Hespellia stercorisuis DSM 15480 TaxID=1121950 RepID=A0A1M6WNU0_9FIRM|nr:glycoside hydrolase family 32 protein [Hespellia stercorisuis]SHK95358.1 beta-fructofuranosidase [Hespellia stercorisuis DSM 15480]
MNALNRDLCKLVGRVEAADLSKINSDPYRLKFHLMPPVGWMNDPNGLCWYHGNYHVYFQYRPFSPDGSGNVFWGHWTSPDFLNWTQQPVFLCPSDTWDLHGVYSGSALVTEEGLYLYYTGNVKYQGDHDYIHTGRGHNTALAISKDGIKADSNQLLLENKDYPDNLTCHVRDPKVWEEDGRFYMVLGARTKEDRGEILVYESEDKVNWNHINTITTPHVFGYMWECPDLFVLDGQCIVALSPQGVSQDGNHYQNVYSCGYFPLYGDFRGEYTLGAFTESDLGFDYYAPQTFEAPDGRRIVIGWMGMPDADYTNPTEKNGWQHGMSVPRELHWNGEQILATPIKELEALRSGMHQVTFSGEEKCALEEGADICIENKSNQLHVQLGDGAEIVYENNLLILKLTDKSGYGRTERVAEVKALQKLRILMDTSALELFINDGQQVMTSRWYPDHADTIAFRGEGSAVVYNMDAMEMIYSEA